jgi:hypothetical protein
MAHVVQTAAQPRQSCFARLLDVRSYVMAARGSMSQAEPASALFMVAVFGLIALVLTPIYISFDLMSTWDFTTGLRQVSEGVVFDMSARAEGFLSLSVGALLTGVIFTGFTLLPSLFELAFPTVNHPLLNLLLLASIVFDYVTDWGKAAELAGGWSDNPTIAFFYTMLVCAFVSIFVQALLVCCLTVVIFGIMAIARGGARQVQAVVLEQ